jgi:hypothetical protein
MATRKHKKTQKRYRKSQSKKRRQRRHKGGCGSCGAKTVGMFGGNPLPGPGDVPLRYYYELNDHNADPLNPQAMTDSRLMVGGKKHKKMRGGMTFSTNTDPLFGAASSYNVPAAFGSYPQALISQNLVSGTSSVNPSTIAQPVETKYNVNNPALA